MGRGRRQSGRNVLFHTIRKGRTVKDKTILLIEDNADDVDLTLRALRNDKIINTVIVARDGQEALEYLFATGSYATRDPREMPSVVLLDLKLPKVDGLDVLRRIRSSEKTKMLPVVVLTSSKHDQDLIQSYSLGANSFIRKPVDFHRFADAIHQLGLYWLILNEPPPVR